MDLIYLDFEGVLHPAAGERGARGFQLQAPGHVLFESLPIFEQAISPYPSLEIVLSTSWVPAYGFKRTLEGLPKSLQSRVIGATWDTRHLHAGDFADASRYQQIKKDVEARDPKRWLAIDDDDEGWADEERDALVLMPEALGLACADARALLRSRLATRFA